MTESSQTLDRGLRVLALLADSPRGRSVADLAAELGVGRAVVYRLLATLRAHNLALPARGDGRVRIGLGVLELARRVRPLLAEAAAGPLRRLAEDLGATAHLTVVDAGEALAVAVVEPTWTDFHVAYRVGSRHPLGRGAAGRAILLAGLAEPHPPYAATAGELQAGAHGVAAPVLDVPGLAASVGVVALTALDPATVGPRVVRAAAAVATALG
ncbi:MAG TPA: helix-turn-helix domain-containing protein [Mycobacteriales bacterium]|nr:helix-turn-helix domain-containing protein [Mycobacteriales bacterium]